MFTSRSTPLLAAVLLTSSLALAQDNLGVAQYTENGELSRPGNLDEWIQTGASLGSEYSDEPFDAANPGTIGTVQMEPAAYRYFLENRKYADGTMFLLSFYRAEGHSEPQLPGFVQGPLMAQEIHVLDKTRFGDGHGFFLFPNANVQASTRIPDGNECVTCHNEHGAFDGTFVQFYPKLRELLGL
jgi:hypothetical protein